MKKSVFFIFFAVILAGLASKEGLSQNVYLQVEDATNFRPVRDVRVTFESETNTFSFMTDPRGEILENIPQGLYSLTFDRRGYHTKTVEDFRVTTQLSTLTIVLNPGETDHRQVDRDTSPIDPAAPLDLFQKSQRRFFIDAGFQMGNVPMVNISAAGAFNNLFAILSFSFLNESYRSSYFVSPEKSYQLSFYDIALGAGLDYEIPNARLGKSSLFVSPVLHIGIEFLNSQDLFEASIDYLMNYFVKPQLSAGINYGRADFYVAGNFMVWLTPGMTNERHGLESGDNGNNIEWEPDLFEGRKGFNTQIGIRLSF